LVRLGGAAIEIRGGVIRRAWVYLPGELEDDDATIYLLDSEGEMVSMWDWEHHPMARVSSADCGELRLVPSVA
jgi:hypothetical protein